MSLIGYLTAKEKQVHLGRLHMRPIQWHLKNNWRVPESLEKVIPIPRSLHPHLRWWLEESNVLPGQPLHSLEHALQILTDASKEGWGAHLNKHTARGNLVPSRKQVAHKLPGAKGSLSGPKRVPRHLIEQHSSHSYRQHHSGCLHKQRGGDEVRPSVCPSVDILWHSRKTGYSQGPTHSRPAECCSRQAIQARPYRSKGSGLSSKSSSKQYAWAVDILSLSWEDVDPYAFPPVAILGKVVEMDYPCRRIILIALVWPNMPWSII